MKKQRISRAACYTDRLKSRNPTDAPHRAVRLDHSETASSRELEQFVDSRIIGTGTEAALQQRGDHIQRRQGDHQPHRGLRKAAGRTDLRRAVVELAVEQQDGREQDDGRDETDQRPGVVVIAKQGRTVAGVSGKDVQQDLSVDTTAPATAVRSDRA